MCVFACTFCLNCQCYSSNDISNDQEAIYYSLCKALYTFIYLRNLKEKSQKIYEKKKPLNLLYQELNTTISIIQKKKKTYDTGEVSAMYNLKFKTVLWSRKKQEQV